MSTRSPRLRKFGALLAWLAVAAVATFAGSLAVGAIGSGILPQAERPLSPEEVDTRLRQATSATPTSAPSSPPGSPALPTVTPTTSPGEVFSSPGGTVIARCAPGVQIVSATPAQGYQVNDVEREDGGQRVRFETGRGSGRNNQVEIRITCTNNHPVAAIR